MDAIVLARSQFAANMTFHILFPTISIALAWVLLFFKLRFNATHDSKWSNAYQFWVKIFALTFALGVVSGITMSFQFGTNWPGFMEKVGNIAGPLLAYEVLTAFFIAGLSAYRWLRGDRGDDVVIALKTGSYLAAILIPVQIFVGDMHGLNTLEHQPAKIAAMEGIWETERGAPLLLFAIPDEQQRSNRYAIGIPKGASLILTHELEGEIKGLNEFVGKHPKVTPLFWGFRIMVGVGMLMLLVSWSSTWQLLKRKQLSPWLARTLVAMMFSGWVATVAGWYVTEIGRQPYLVYGVLATADAASNVPSAMIASTLAIYLVLYLILIAAYISVVLYLARKAKHGAEADGQATPQLATA